MDHLIRNPSANGVIQALPDARRSCHAYLRRHDAWYGPQHTERKTHPLDARAGEARSGGAHRSGLALRAFAVRRGIDYRWRTRFSRASVRSRAGVASPGFTEVTVSGTPVAQYRALGNGSRSC